MYPELFCKQRNHEEEYYFSTLFALIMWSKAISLVAYIDVCGTVD